MFGLIRYKSDDFSGNSNTNSGICVVLLSFVCKMAKVINRFSELAEKQDLDSDTSFEKAISEAVESAVQAETYIKSVPTNTGVRGQELCRARSSRLLSARLRSLPGVFPCQE